MTVWSSVAERRAFRRYESGCRAREAGQPYVWSQSIEWQKGYRDAQDARADVGGRDDLSTDAAAADDARQRFRSADAVWPVRG